MTRTRITILIVLIAAVCVLLLQQAGAFSLREFFGFGQEETGTTTAETATETDTRRPGAAAQRQAGGDWASPQQEPEAELTFEEIRRVVSSADAAQRRALLEDGEKFRQFVRQEARNAALLTAARSNNLHEDPDVRFLMQRAADNVLRQVYLNRLIDNQIPEGFPSDAQVREYYDKNRDRFRLGDRVHVWQVFLPLTPETDAATVAAKAQSIVADIRSGETSFSRAALEHSAHQPSRNNGGYMGLVKVEELRPGLAEPLLSLQQGKVSDPVRTDQGLHILKKGETVAGRDVALDEVRGQVRQLLRNQAVKQLRQAIYDKAGETYPVQLPESRIEEWRLRLRTGADSGSEGTGTQ